MDNRSIVELGLGDCVSVPLCPYCGSDSAQSLPQPHSPVYYVFPAGRARLHPDCLKLRTLVKCSACHLIYYTLIPSRDVLDRLNQQAGIVYRWSWSPQRGLAQKFFPLVLQERTSCQVLDVGCHTGQFLQLLPQHWRKWGVDANAIALDQAKKYNPEAIFRLGYLDAVALPSSGFDVVTMWDVMEHLDDVTASVRKVANVLRPGGFFILETGDTSSIGARLFGPTWYYYSFLEHFVFFDRFTITKVLRENRLEVLAIRGTRHHNLDLGLSLVGVCRAMVFMALTLRGRHSGWWNKLARRAGRSGSVPAAFWLPDHMLVVARRALE